MAGNNDIPDRYATNQFYNITSLGEPVRNTVDTRDNPDFLWPGKFHRNAVTGVSTKVQRGYIRLISNVLAGNANLSPQQSSALVNLSTRRFNFQFNPDTLTRSVTARNDVHLWMNQDPAQFTQPIPGDANFSFEIILNREAEVASGRFSTGNGSLSSERRTPTDITGENNYSQSSVTDIGVLSDLLVFDEIIGQGINKDLIQAIVSRSKDVTDYANQETNKRNANKDEADKEETITFDPDKATTYLQGAIGNSAFLISQPVRVVFSSLFMVEGFVTATNVVFNKFNPAMVPTQCTISVSMQALYIGFARKKTFLNTVYKESDVQLANIEDENTAINESLVSYGKKIFSGFEVGRAGIFGGDAVAANFNASRILGGGDTSKDVKVHLRFISGDSIKEYAKNRLGSLTAKVVWRITYERTSGVPEGVDYTAGEEVVTLTQSQEFKISDVADGADTVAWYFNKSNLPNFAAKKWDQTDGAVYKSQFYIVYTITNGSVTVNADEWAYAEVTANWNDEKELQKYIKTRTYSSSIPDDIKKLVGFAD